MQPVPIPVHRIVMPENVAQRAGQHTSDSFKPDEEKRTGENAVKLCSNAFGIKAFT
jgi:hypothetical protein